MKLASVSPVVPSVKEDNTRFYHGSDRQPAWRGSILAEGKTSVLLLVGLLVGVQNRMHVRLEGRRKDTQPVDEPVDAQRHRAGDHRGDARGGQIEVDRGTDGTGSDPGQDAAHRHILRAVGSY